MDRPASEDRGLAETTADQLSGSDVPFHPTVPGLAIGALRAEPRYLVEDLLGKGANGRVYLVEDRDLGRRVAVKVLAGDSAPGRIEAFLHEARVAAALEHPNIAPVYEVATTDLGQVWFSMRRIEGETLEAALAAEREGRDHPLGDHHRRVSLILDVANALRAAHAQGIVHRDVKPANIMLGRYGEVLLLDWGTAAASGTDSHPGGPVGTPLYMSPQQACGDEATPADDIYGLGATLCELLLRRPPLRSRLPDLFWKLKQAGTIDAFTAEERGKVPRQLLAVVQRALEAHPVRRYQTIDAFAADLDQWQAGQPVSACRETIDERLRRIWRRHGRRLLVAALIVAPIALLALALYGEHLKDRATWGTPVYTQDFSGAALDPDLTVIRGEGVIRDGGFVTTHAQGTMLLCKRRFDGPTAIEYDGSFPSDSSPCDLSLLWMRQIRTDADGSIAMVRPYKLQFGAYDGSYTALLNDGERHLTWSPVRPEAGRIHRIRVEIVDDRLTMRVDGRLVISYRDPFPLEGGYFVLYGYYPGKRFDNVKVFNLGLPRRLPATALGDHLAELGLREEAETAYRRVMESQPGTREAGEAQYRIGLGLLRAGDSAAAFAAWAGLEHTPYAREVALAQWEADWRSGVESDYEGRLFDLVQGADADERSLALQAWTDRTYAVVNRPGPPDAEAIDASLALGQRCFPGEPYLNRIGAEAFYRLGRYQEILDRYPDQRRQCVFALVSLGRSDEAIATYPDQVNALYQTFTETGRWREIAQALPGFPRDVQMPFEEGRLDEVPSDSGSGTFPVGACARIMQGDFAAARAAWPGHARVESLILMHEGRWSDLVEDHPEMAEGHVAVGDAAAAQLCGDGRLGHAVAAFAALGRGEVDVARQHLATAEETFDARVFRRRLDHLQVWMGAFVAERLGEEGAWTRALIQVRDHARWNNRQRPWHVVRYLLGEIDEAAFLAQPFALQADADLILLQAVRADQAGDPGAADAYRRWLALPSWRRNLFAPTIEDAFVSWRLGVLAPPL